MAQRSLRAITLVYLPRFYGKDCFRGNRENLKDSSFEVGQSYHLVPMFLGGIAVANGILVPNTNFVRLGTRELLGFSLLSWQGSYGSGKTWKTWKKGLFGNKLGKTWKTQGILFCQTSLIK